MLTPGELHAGLYVTIHEQAKEEKEYDDNPFSEIFAAKSKAKGLDHLMGVPLKITGVNLPYIVCVYQALVSYSSLFSQSRCFLRTPQITNQYRCSNS